MGNEKLRGLEEIFLGEKEVRLDDSLAGQVCIEFGGCSCAIVYEGEIKQASVLTVRGFKNRLQKKGLFMYIIKRLQRKVGKYGGIINKLENSGYKVERYDLLDPHLIKIVT